MPRKPRMYLPDVPCHVIQRGNNRDATFYAEQDYQFYLECLDDASTRYGAAVHAYVLMTNHVHLLMTPAKTESISLTMQSIGRRYVQYINKEYKRSGTLWESRHKASVIDQEKYLFHCCRYIELNPVRAGMVVHPADYRWSSYRCNAMGEFNKIIQPHALYQAIGLNDAERYAAYQDLFRYELDVNVVRCIRNAALFSMPTGDNRFKEQIEVMQNCKLGYAKRGRPLKSVHDRGE
jgi:putative transposase